MNRELDIDIGGEAPRDPEELEAAATADSAEISAETKPGPVHLTVADLERSLDYYRRAVGLTVRERDGTTCATLGTNATDLLVLVEEPGARSANSYTGLYHFALLVPERLDLARWLAHAARDGVQLTGVADHFVSEALYLSDPDGHGIEIYWDRPRATWEGQVASRLTTVPLDIDGLLNEIEDPTSEPFDGLPPGTVMGHVHLKVSTIAETVAFYRDVLGFALMAQLGRSAAFLAAGGYHHHLGANTWESAGASPPPPGAAALRCVTFVLPDADELERVSTRLEKVGHTATEHDGGILVRDPSANAVVLMPRAP